MFKCKLFVGIALLGFSAVSQARDIYVGCGVNASDANVIGAGASNRNSQSKPYLKPEAADTAAVPGDTIYLMAQSVEGTACTYGAIPITTSGSAALPITWSGTLPGKTEKAHIKITEANFNASRYWGIKIAAAYIRVTGFKLTGMNDLVTLAEAKKNIELQDPYKKLSKTAPTNLRKYPDNPRFNLSGITGLSEPTTAGVYTHHVVVDNNDVSKFGCSGIGLSGDYFTVKNNNIWDNSWYSGGGCSGISIFTIKNADSLPGYRNQVYRNKVWNNKQLVNTYYTHPLLNASNSEIGNHRDGHGILFDVDLTPGGYKGRSLIADNISAGNGGAGITTFKQRHIDIFNNTLYKNGIDLAGSATGTISATESEDIRVINNIVWLTATNNITGSSFADTVYDHNVYWYDGAATRNFGAVGGIYNRSQPSPIHTFAIVFGANDVIANPGFVNPLVNLNNPAADFSLKSNSPAIDKGVIISSNSDPFGGNTPFSDIVFTPRTSGRTIDIGAYEYPASAIASAPLPALNTPLYIKIPINKPVQYQLNTSGASSFRLEPAIALNLDGSQKLDSSNKPLLGTAAPGFTINNQGLISGTTPANTLKASSYVMTIIATNAAGSVKKSVVFIVDPTAITFPGTGVYKVQNRVGVSLDINATNNPTSFAIDKLPTGLQINPTTGLISGTVTDANSSNLTSTITVKNRLNGADVSTKATIVFNINPDI